MKLSKHVRYRKEKDTIFICNCKELQDFQIPLNFWDFLNNLKQGKKMQMTSDQESLYEDLKKAGFLIEQ